MYRIAKIGTKLGKERERGTYSYHRFWKKSESRKVLSVNSFFLTLYSNKYWTEKYSLYFNRKLNQQSIDLLNQLLDVLLNILRK